MKASELEQACVNTIRFLAVDMVEKASSGHPGLPMGAAPMAYVLWTRFLRHNPRNPGWWDRDRFVLSAGHGSALLYSLLHLTGYGLHVVELDDGNDLVAIDHAIHSARDVSTRPCLISVRTVLGYGAPDKQGTFHAHGSPLGAEEMLKAKRNLGWPQEPPFCIPDEALAHLRSAIDRGRELEETWNQRLEAYQLAFPDLAREIKRRFSGELPDGWADNLPAFPADATGMPTRKASEAVMQALARTVPELVGGSGDLDPSTYTWLKEDGDFESPQRSPRLVQGLVGGGWGYGGRNLHFGVREHAMAAAVNGLVYHGGFIPFAATFLIFSDYMRPSIRLAALAKLHATFVFTHDSIGVGEDGPSHEPIEQVASLRAIPNLLVIRPCDANETRWAWQTALEQRGRPTALALTRQHVPTLDRTTYASAELLRRGAYVLNAHERKAPDVILDRERLGGRAQSWRAEPILRKAHR